MANHRVFVSYRRSDQANDVDRLRKGLERVLGSVTFVDAHSIRGGYDFFETIRKALFDCEVLLAVIGPRWETLLQEKTDGEKDYVRIEIDEALKRGIPIIPVLLNRAEMPREADLPPGLRPLAGRQAIVVGRRGIRYRGLEELSWTISSKFLEDRYRGQARIDAFKRQEIVRECAAKNLISETLAKKSELVVLREGETLYPMGTDGKVLYFVLSGRLTLNAGGWWHHYLLEPDEIVGEFPILLKGQPTYLAKVKARELSAVAWVPAKDFEDIADANPDLWRGIGKMLAQRLIGSNRQRRRFERWAVVATAAAILFLSIILLRG